MKVLALRPGSIGNSLAATPGIRAIKKTHPDWHITVLTDDMGAEIFYNSPYVDDIILYDKKGRDRGILKYFRFIMSLRKKEFDAAILFKRFTRMGFIAYFSGADVRIGFEHGSPLATCRIPYREDVNIFEQNVKLACQLDAEPHGIHPEIWPTEEDRAWVYNFLDKQGIDAEESFVVMHPAGQSQRKKLWSVKNFSTLADRIVKELEMKVIFLEGPGEEQIAEALDEAGSISGSKYFHSNGKLSIRQTAFLVSRAKIFIGSDSGPAHLASAVDVPEIVIYPPREDLDLHLVKWRPVGDNVHVLAPGKPCSLCMDFPCSEEGWDECYNREVSVERVFEELKALII